MGPPSKICSIWLVSAGQTLFQSSVIPERIKHVVFVDPTVTTPKKNTTVHPHRPPSEYHPPPRRTPPLTQPITGNPRATSPCHKGQQVNTVLLREEHDEFNVFRNSGTPSTPLRPAFPTDRYSFPWDNAQPHHRVVHRTSHYTTRAHCHPRGPPSCPHPRHHPTTPTCRVTTTSHLPNAANPQRVLGAITPHTLV